MVKCIVYSGSSYGRKVFGKFIFILLSIWKKVWQINRSAKRLILLVLIWMVLLWQITDDSPNSSVFTAAKLYYNGNIDELC